MYVGNLQKLKGIRDRITKYNMADPLKIPNLVDLITENPGKRWGGKETKTDLLNHWSQISLSDVIAFQRDTNCFGSEENMASSDWVKDLMVNSSEDELK